MEKHQMDKWEWLDKGALKWLYQTRHPQAIKGKKGDEDFQLLRIPTSQRACGSFAGAVARASRPREVHELP